jgi:hypothetical protein
VCHAGFAWFPTLPHVVADRTAGRRSSCWAMRAAISTNRSRRCSSSGDRSRSCSR